MAENTSLAKCSENTSKCWFHILVLFICFIKFHLFFKKDSFKIFIFDGFFMQLSSFLFTNGCCGIFPIQKPNCRVTQFSKNDNNYPYHFSISIYLSMFSTYLSVSYLYHSQIEKKITLRQNSPKKILLFYSFFILICVFGAPLLWLF